MSLLIRLFILIVTLGTPISNANGSSVSSPTRAIARSKYTAAHSLGSGYKFNAADGWQHVNASSMFSQPMDSFIGARSGKKKGFKVKSKSQAYKLKPETIKPKSTKKNGKPKGQGLSVVGVIQGIASDVWKGLKGLGKKEDVTITWYTGEDLKHPSCWPNTKWAPTDKSFAAALTIEGWDNKPECFRFLELCNGPEKCIFARVVDTCAGCRHKHVDLTRAAFGALADFDEGILTAQFRLATEPSEWYQDLWGPKI